MCWWIFVILHIYVGCVDTSKYHSLFKIITTGGEFDETESFRYSSDGGFILTGTISSLSPTGYKDVLIAKFDSEYDLSWIATLGSNVLRNAYDHGNDIIETSEGFISTGKFLTGENDSLLITKFDFNGGVEWVRTIGTYDLFDSGKSLLLASDKNHFVVAGETTSFGPTSNTKTNIFIGKFVSQTGNSIWHTVVGWGTQDLLSGKVFQTADGGYILTSGISSETSLASAFLVKLNSNGNLDFVYSYEVNGSSLFFDSSFPTPAGDFIICGRVSNSENGSFLYGKINSTGNVQWMRRVYVVADSCSWCTLAVDVQPTSDGGFIISGFMGKASSWYDAFVAKLAPNSHDVEWVSVLDEDKAKNELPTYLFSSARSVREVKDGYVIVGHIYGSGGPPYRSFGVLSRLDGSGDGCMWKKKTFTVENVTLRRDVPSGVEVSHPSPESEIFTVYTHHVQSYGGGKTYCKQCHEHYAGPICDVTYCDGIMSNDSSKVCSGRGECNDFDDCECEGNFALPNCYLCLGGWAGTDCNDGICFSETNPSACYGDHGNCIGPNNCSCESGYFGSNCSMFSCLGIHESDPKVCSSHGNCVSPDICSCYVDSRFYGQYCDEFIPPGVKYVLGHEFIGIAGYNVPMFNLPAKFRMHTFNCSLILGNAEDAKYFLSCSFDFGHSGRFTNALILNVFAYEFDPVKDLNNSLLLKPVTTCNECGGSTELVEVKIGVTRDRQIVEDQTIMDEITATVELWGEYWYVFMVVGILGLLACCCSLIFVLCCLCCCCSCGIVLFVISQMMTCCGAGTLFIQRDVTKWNKYRRLKNLTVLLNEQEVEEEAEEHMVAIANHDLAHLSIKKDMFKIPMEEIKLEKLVGKGGSNSTVYRGKWKGSDVCFKCFNTKVFMSSDNYFNEFEKEVAVFSNVSHPNILRFFGASIKPPRVGILMEYCENGDLDQFLQKYKKENGGKMLSLSEKIRIAKEIISGMEYLHSRKIIHRDLKLENVLISSSFNAKLMDFGLSKIADRVSRKLTHGIGTSIYMAPEIVYGGTQYTRAIDVFSFGILLYVLLTENREPYGESSGFGIELRVANDATLRPDLDILAKSLPKEYDWIIKVLPICWQHLAENRYDFSQLSVVFQEGRLVELSDGKGEAIQDVVAENVDSSSDSESENLLK